VSRVLIVSGPPGAGKTTAAEELARRHEPGVHLLTDVFFSAIRTGFIEPWRSEAHQQNDTVIRVAAEAAAAFARGGYFVAIDGVVFEWALAIYAEVLGRDGIDPDVVALLPPVGLLLERGPGRVREREPDEAAYRSLHQQFVECRLPRFDPSGMTPSEVADAVASVARPASAVLAAP
jgi:hypothetical protein